MSQMSLPEYLDYSLWILSNIISSSSLFRSMQYNFPEEKSFEEDIGDGIL